MSSSLVTLIMFTFFLCIVQVWNLRRKSRKNKKKQQLPLPPGPTPRPLVGSVPKMLRNKSVFRWIHGLMKDMYTDISLIRLGNTNKVWDNPLKFDPERHFKDGSHQVVLTEHDLRFISFSTGRRGCPGSLLGTSKTTMLLARLLQCSSWTPANNASSVDLRESTNELVLATPLTLLATPRLPPHIYPTSN